MEQRGCASFSSHSNFSLCPVLQQLKDEHGPLNELKLDMMQTATRIYESTSLSSYTEALTELKEKVTAFFTVLNPHSEREEGVLFPMMANYIGRDMGPIAVMEYEHNQAKAHISYFLEHTKTIAEDITLEKTKELAQHVINAYNILTDHFYKEENVLFPMAEQMLTAEEKTELAVQIASI